MPVIENLPWNTKDGIIYDCNGKYRGKTKEYGTAATLEQIKRAEQIVEVVNKNGGKG